jgi:tight adherence protein B
MSFLSSPIGMIMIFALVLGGIVMVYGYIDPSFGSSKAVQKRLDRIIDKKAGKARRKQASAVDITGVKPKGLIDAIATRLTPRPDKLRARLARTGRQISIGQFLTAMLIVTAISYVLIRTSAGQTAIASLFFAMIAGMILPQKYINRLIDKRSRAFLSQFPDAIDLVVRGVRSGLPIGESIKSIAKEMPDPVGTEFAKVNDGMKLGQTIEAALWDCSNRLDLPEVKFFVIALSIQRETGGNLAETLENLSGILRTRRYKQMKVRAMSSEARASAMIIGSLPFAMFGILMLMNPKYMKVLLTDPRGHMLLGIALALIFTGNFIMRKIAKFKI